ncbi:sex-determining region Y protein-like [Uloborus diversus]|uniref:sex-determining region Y protein-like n=1 Tax=Uloborus diversus TaxID=327109 RepID=UPI002409FE27|nr:sex-determining region Y protein-like [Uloborus diversus]
MNEELHQLLIILSFISSGFSSEDDTTQVYHPFRFGYELKGEDGHQYRKEEADANGQVRGSYGFIDAEGTYREVFYLADDDGFKVIIKSNEPGVKNENPAHVKIYSSSYHNNQYIGKPGDIQKAYKEPHKNRETPTHDEQKNYEHNSDHYSEDNFKKHQHPHEESPPLKGEEEPTDDYLNNHHQSHKLINDPPKNHKSPKNSYHKFHPSQQQESHAHNPQKSHHQPSDEYSQEEGDNYSIENKESENKYDDKENKETLNYDDEYDESDRNRFKQLEKEVELKYRGTSRIANTYGQ